MGQMIRYSNVKHKQMKIQMFVVKMQVILILVYFKQVLIVNGIVIAANLLHFQNKTVILFKINQKMYAQINKALFAH